MARTVKILLRYAGLIMIGLAMLGGLPGPYPTLMGIGGAVMFFATGTP